MAGVQRVPFGVVQVVEGTTTTATQVASTSYADTTLTASITPKFATSKVWVMISQSVRPQAQSNAYLEAYLQLLRDASVIRNFGNVVTQHAGTGSDGFASVSAHIAVTYLDSPATTSSVTYKTQGKVGSTGGIGSANFQVNSSYSTITLFEIKV
jgi:hypothetical protein